MTTYFKRTANDETLFHEMFFAASERGNFLARKQNAFAKMLRGRVNNRITGIWNRVPLPMFYGIMHRKMKTPVIYKRVKSYFDRESFVCMLFKTVDGPREVFHGPPITGEDKAVIRFIKSGLFPDKLHTTRQIEPKRQTAWYVTAWGPKREDLRDYCHKTVEDDIPRGT